MNSLYLIIPIIALVLYSNSCTKNDSTPAKIVKTFPIAGSTDVYPGLIDISVTFSKSVTDGNWSWTYTYKDKFPELIAQPYYLPDINRDVLPVKLEPNREYEFWIHIHKNKKVKNEMENPIPPYRLRFKTR